MGTATGTFRTALVAAALLGFIGLVRAEPALTQGEDSTAPLNTKDLSAQSPRDVYLEVELNGRPTSIIVHFRNENGRLSAAGHDLDEIGLKIDRLGLRHASDVQLDAIDGLHYRYDAARQVVELQASDDILKPYIFDTRPRSEMPRASSSTGLFINYDVFAQNGSGEQLALANDEHLFNPLGVLSNSGIANFLVDGHHYTRYMTTWTHSNQATNTTTQVGDTISSSLSWSRAIRMAGFQWGSNFELRPDLVTFPVPALYGSAVVPSSVDVFIDNVKRYSGNVPSGPFIVNDVPGINGAGEATIITHDALGRTIATSMPLYVDSRMLAAGLSSYSFEAGFVRRDYGLKSFSYNPRPALSGTARYGMTNALTLEGHAEATHGLINTGGGALLRFGQLGVMNGSMSASMGRTAGTQLSLGYQFVERRFSISAQTVRAFGHFGDIASSEDAPVPLITDRATLSFPLMRHQTLSLSYIGSKYPQAPASKIGAISYTLNFGDLISVSLSAYNDFKQRDASGAFLTVSLGFLRNGSISASAGRDNGQSNYNVSAIRTPDYDGGWGWGVQAGGMNATRFGQGQLQYLGGDGQLTAAAQRIGKDANESLDLTGALVLMDGSIHLARHIDGSFALVSTDGVAGIPVLHENRPIGVTDRTGHLLVPDLNAYQSNQVSIDPMKLPANARLAVTSMSVTPQARSGVLAHFGVTRYRAASVIVHGPNGVALPPGTPVHDEDNGKDTIVGYDGLAFVDDLADDNHLTIGSGSSQCTVQFAYLPPNDGSLPTIGPLTCRATAGGRP